MEKMLSEPIHVAHVYEDDNCLTTAVGDFLAAGLNAGQPVICLATPSHLEGIVSELSSRQFDVKRIVCDGLLTLVDGVEALGMIMAGSKPDPNLFRQVVTRLLRQAATIAPVPVRIYGELVDILWRKGNPEAAVQLEELWNELGDTASFSLLCGYSMGNVYHEKHWHHFENVCREHRTVHSIDRTRGIHRPRRLSFRTESRRLQRAVSS